MLAGRYGIDIVHLSISLISCAAILLSATLVASFETRGSVEPSPNPPAARAFLERNTQTPATLFRPSANVCQRRANTEKLLSFSKSVWISIGG